MADIIVLFLRPLSMSFHDSLAPKLPYDIVICVIETLLAECSEEPEECVDILQTFSLVSQSFVVFCQKKLFRRFNMGKIDGTKCYSILEHSPHLIPYVEEVWMYLGWRGVVNVTVAEMEVLRVLTSLRHLSVVALADPKGRNAIWQHLSLSVRRTIYHLLLRPQITSFAIMGVEALPFPLLSTLNHLKSLDVRDDNSNPRFHPDSDEEDTDDEDGDGDGDPDFHRLALSLQRAPLGDPDAIRLENLSLIDSDHVLLFTLLDPDEFFDDEWNDSLFTPLPTGSPDPDRANGLEISQTYRLFNANYNVKTPSPFDFSQLRSFTIDITKDNLLPVFHIIHHARSTLVTLDIRARYLHNMQQDPFGFDSGLDHLPEPLPNKVSLEPLTNLRHLSLTILILGYMPMHLNALSSWCSLLHTAPHGIRTLEITLDAFFFDFIIDLLPWFPELDEDDDAANTPFSTLDEIISSLDCFPCLEFVRVCVKLPEDDRYIDSEPDMTVDVVDEQDLTALKVWVETYDINDGFYAKRTPSRTPSPLGMTVDVVTEEDLAMYDAMGDNFEPDHSDSSGTNSSYIGTEPSFDDESAETRSHLIPFERVEESISQMLRFTAMRLRPTNSFVVEVDFGAHVGLAAKWTNGARIPGRELEEWVVGGAK